MKTINFSKRILVTLAIAILCCFSAKAQDKGDWSLIPHVKSGAALDFLYFPYDGMVRVDAGVDAKYNFNTYLSLLAGVEYEYRGFRYRVAVDGVVSGADTFGSKNKKLILYTDKE